MLHPRIVEELRAIEGRLRAEGKLPSAEQLVQYVGAFREKFGPEVLRGLDGETLLKRMHGLGITRDSVAYWLEFKNDDEFPALFGSIAGGSALKWGVYLDRGSEQWMGRSSANANTPAPVTLEQAIETARRHRDQLVRGCELMEQVPALASDEVYRALQANMDQLAPDVSNSAWGHKYFSLLFMDKLENYHVEHFQRFYLVKLLQYPPVERGRFLAGGQYVRIATELGLPLNHLTCILNEWTPKPYRYWRLKIEDSHVPGREQDAAQLWQIMREKSCLAIGWTALGSLTDIEHTGAGKSSVGERLAALGADVTGLRQTLFDFVSDVQPGEPVVVFLGSAAAGIAKVVSNYYYEPGTVAPHRLPVNWLSLDAWQPASRDLLAGSLVLREANSYAFQLEVERRMLEASATATIVSPPAKPSMQPETREGKAVSPLQGVRTTLPGMPGTVQGILGRKGQVILYGPPGTGKTYWALQTAQQLAAQIVFERDYTTLGDAEQGRLMDADLGYIRLCTFHPAYGYEDFLEGYRPAVADGQMQFVLRDGIFKRLCRQAAEDPNHGYFLIIDEINRGDIPRIFGELLTLLEVDKRGRTPVVLPLSGEPFTVPPNVYVIGTMNTADRSIALLDTALRRRFGFVELMPDVGVLSSVAVGQLPLGAWLRQLNRRIVEHVGRDGRNLQVGHSYFLYDGQPLRNVAQLARVLREDIIPLLEEYCYADQEQLERILGSVVFDATSKQIRTQLFEPGSEADLVTALLALTPELRLMQDGDAETDDDVEQGVDAADSADLANGEDGTA